MPFGFAINAPRLQCWPATSATSLAAGSLLPLSLQRDMEPPGKRVQGAH
jgi:hypothetical protein